MEVVVEVIEAEFIFILMFWKNIDLVDSRNTLKFTTFLSEAVEASRCYFFENLWMKLKSPLLLKPRATIVQENFQSFYPSEPFRVSHFTMRHYKKLILDGNICRKKSRTCLYFFPIRVWYQQYWLNSLGNIIAYLALIRSSMIRKSFC